jgi:hypothetical protein
VGGLPARVVEEGRGEVGGTINDFLLWKRIIFLLLVTISFITLNITQPYFTTNI